MTNALPITISPEFFEFSDLPDCVVVTSRASSTPQLAAFGILLLQKGQIRGFQEIRPLTAKWPESLRIPGKSRKDAETLLASVTDVELEQESTRLIRAQKNIESKIEFERKLGEMSLLDFTKLFCESSGKKFNMDTFKPHFLVIPKELLLVTHFKALASMTRYNAKTREFSATELNQDERAKLFKLAAKIGKTKKKVTREDILARRKRIREKLSADTGPLHMDFYEAEEDFGKERALEWLMQGRLDEPASNIWMYE